MPEKTLSTHILNKHDVDANWEDSSYVAKSGELIVYDVDSNNTSPKLKIGDGNTVTDDLPFIAAGSVYSGTLPVGTDLNTLYGNQYWGKIYWLVDTHGISNTPNSVTSGSVEIIRAGYSSTIQIFRTSAASSSSSRPTSYQRRIDDQNPDNPTEWEEIVTAEGSYPSLMSGGVVAVSMASATDINDFYGADYWGKEFYCMGGKEPINSPPSASGGSLQVLRAGGNTTYQVYRAHSASDSSNKPTTWQRARDSNTWTDWEEIVTSDGSYPTLGAGYLAKTATVATTTNSAQYGWWRFARLPFSTLTSISGTSSYSAILLVNSVNPAGISSTSAVQSGLIELDLRLDGGKPTNINTNDVMKVLCGSLSPDLFCCTVSDTEIEFYVYLNGAYNRRNFTVLNEVYRYGERVDALEFEPLFVSSSAPEGAIYAVVRNNASKAIETSNNLLLNGDFRLNTQGLSSYPSNNTSLDECVDGWLVIDSPTRKGSIDVNDGGGVTINATSTGFGIRQWIEPRQTGAGKTFTLTVNVSNVGGNSETLTVYLRNDVYNASYGYKRISTAGIYTIPCTIPEDATGNLLVYIAVEGTSSFSGECNYTIDWIKLEEGDLSTAPNGLVQNATQALYAAAAKGAEELSKGVEIAITTNTGWHKFMEAGGVSTSHGFSAIVLVNGELNVNSPDYTNQEGSGIIEVDYYNSGGSAIRAAVYILAGNLSPEDFYITASGNSVSVYKNYHSTYMKTKFTELSIGGMNATTTYVDELQETAPTGGNVAVIRNVASQTENVNIKTYTALSQLGLSYPCTTVQIMNALPLGSRIDVAVEAISSSSMTEPNITDTPSPFGTLSIIRAMDGGGNNAYNRYVVTFVKGLSDDHSVWFGEYVADADTQTIASVEWKEIINADGTSTPLTAAQALYAQSIPTASETVIGGVKVYRDSEGYFCIDTQ